jgi:hypothetical protein
MNLALTTGREVERMRSKGFCVGLGTIAVMTVVAAMAFVDTARPVAAAQPRLAGVQANGRECAYAEGWIGIHLGRMPQSCAQVHALALASGNISRSDYDLAKAKLSLLSAQVTSDRPR